jgi:XTP/dITP diphosphohydrolase
VVVAIAPAGRDLVAVGFVEGSIAEQPARESGFGYDPEFVPLGLDRSFAQLGADAKAQLSHRAHAARALRDQLLALQAAGAS